MSVHALDRSARIKQIIESKIERVPESGCWLWTGATIGSGYGSFSMGKHNTFYAHRESYKAYVGSIPDGMYVMHKCDVRCCCNPDHLGIGTQLDNMRDAKRKGRTVNCGFASRKAA